MQVGKGLGAQLQRRDPPRGLDCERPNFPAEVGARFPAGLGWHLRPEGRHRQAMSTRQSLSRDKAAQVPTGDNVRQTCRKRRSRAEFWTKQNREWANSLQACASWPKSPELFVDVARDWSSLPENQPMWPTEVWPKSAENRPTAPEVVGFPAELVAFARVRSTMLKIGRNPKIDRVGVTC